MSMLIFAAEATFGAAGLRASGRSMFGECPIVLPLIIRHTSRYMDNVHLVQDFDCNRILKQSNK